MFIMSMSALLFSSSSAYAAGSFVKSSYVCFSPVESAFLVGCMQVFGLLLDTAIATLLWRLLAWSRRTIGQLQTLAAVLILSSAAMTLLSIAGHLFAGSQALSRASMPYMYDVLLDSVLCACLLVSSTFWVCEASPITVVAVATFLTGIWTSSDGVFGLAYWASSSSRGPLASLWLGSIGAIGFVYSHDLRYIAFVRRGFLVFFLAVLLITASVFSAVETSHKILARHLISDVISKAGLEHDRWVKQAAMSKSIHTAVTTYRERHGARLPPPKFAEWYHFARGAVCIDDFRQIDNDLEPFWTVEPTVLREMANAMAAEPDVASITIEAGKAWASSTEDVAGQRQLQSLVDAIGKFSKHLPDMVLPINLASGPRVLPPWEEAYLRRQHDGSSMVDLVSRRSRELINDTASVLHSRRAAHGAFASGGTSAAALRDMISQACPPTSAMRVSPHWSRSKFCSACIKGHSDGPALTRLGKSLEICSQPDMKLLHGFFTTTMHRPLIHRLTPLFGPSKTDGFRDIIIPMPDSWGGVEDVPWQFLRKYDRLLYVGRAGKHAISTEELGGSHKYRLLNLVNGGADRTREVTMVLPAPGSEDKFRYESVPAADANGAVPLRLGLGDYSACEGNSCGLVRQVYGELGTDPDPMEHRYVLLLDEDDGPSPQLVPMLRSLVVPFVSTIFQTWYTERLMPWLHYVPVDPRYHALHTTLAFFSGTQGRGGQTGGARGMEMKPHLGEAEFIARQGQKWADKALGQREMEVYLFRLLLEWGRLIDNRRGEIGAREAEDGQIHDGGWSERRDSSTQ